MKPQAFVSPIEGVEMGIVDAGGETAGPLIDRAQNALHRTDKNLVGAVRKPHPSARPALFRLARLLDRATAFRFDAEMVAAVTEAAESPAPILRASLSTARPPTEVCWIEWSDDARQRAMHGTATPDGGLDIGYLVEMLPDRPGQWRATAFWAARGRRLIGPVTSPVAVAIDPRAIDIGSVGIHVSTGPDAWSPTFSDPVVGRGLDITLDPQTSRLADAFHHLGANVTKRVRDGWPVPIHAMLGWQWSEKQTDDDLNALQHQIGAVTTAGWVAALGHLPGCGMPQGEKSLASGETRELLRRGLRAIEDDGRFLIAALAALNARRFCERTQTRGATTRSISTRTVRVPAFSEVRLVAPREIAIRAYRRAVVAGARRARHEVLGHWVERRASRSGCGDHQWVGLDDRRQRCSICGHSRWWRQAHARGDGDKAPKRRFRVTSSPSC